MLPERATTESFSPSSWRGTPPDTTSSGHGQVAATPSGAERNPPEPEMVVRLPSSRSGTR